MNHKYNSTSNPSVYGSQTTIDLCTTFCNSAIRTWNYLQFGLRSRIELGEETITDINLLEIQIRHPNEVRTAKFNRIKEGKIGADWEWWLGSKSGWIGLRIQAKKLNSNSLKYDSLDYVNKNKRQVDLLIQDANHNKLIPMYCFYNYWDNGRFFPRWNCGTYSTSELYGCTISSAKNIKSLIDSNDKSLKSVSQNALPWNYLVCCHRYSHSKADLTERALGVLQSVWDVEDKQIHIFKEPLPYVTDILYNEFPNIEHISHIIVVTEGIM